MANQNRGQRGVRQRLDPNQREHLIVEGAIVYFAEKGFESRTRGLADHLGVSQSLLYRYFPNVSALIARVYEAIYVGRWDNNWQNIIGDRSVDLESRLKTFYNSYYHNINRYDTIRISLFSALRGESIASRYVRRVRDDIIRPIVAEIRHEYGMDDVADTPIHPLEEELVFSLHATIIYPCFREYVFELRTEDQGGLLIELYVESFMKSAKTSFERVHKSIGM